MSACSHQASALGIKMTATPQTATFDDYHLENVYCLSLLNRRAFPQPPV
jgi:hypothetical protein